MDIVNNELSIIP